MEFSKKECNRPLVEGTWLGTSRWEQAAGWCSAHSAVLADNGKHFSEHAEVGEALGAGVYVATPNASWQQGLNEHTNGLLRQYFGQGCTCAADDEPQLARVQDWLNDRPCKALGFRTPAAVFGTARSAGLGPGPLPRAPRAPVARRRVSVPKRSCIRGAIPFQQEPFPPPHRH